MPIHQTKLIIAKPQATGMLMPQMPTPLASSTPMAAVRTITRIDMHMTRMSQVLPTGRVSTIELILSVTVEYECPGAMTGVSTATSTESGIGCDICLLH